MFQALFASFIHKLTTVDLKVLEQDAPFLSKQFHLLLSTFTLHDANSPERLLYKEKNLNELMQFFDYTVVERRNTLHAWQLEVLYLHQDKFKKFNLEDYPEIKRDFEEVLNTVPFLSLGESLSASHNLDYFPKFDPRKNTFVFASREKFLGFFNFLLSRQYGEGQIEALLKVNNQDNITVSFVKRTENVTAAKKLLLQQKELACLSFTLATDQETKSIFEIEGTSDHSLRIQAISLTGLSRFQIASALFKSTHILFSMSKERCSALFSQLVQQAGENSKDIFKKLTHYSLLIYQTLLGVTPFDSESVEAVSSCLKNCTSAIEKKFVLKTAFLLLTGLEDAILYQQIDELPADQLHFFSLFIQENLQVPAEKRLLKATDCPNYAYLPDPLKSVISESSLTLYNLMTAIRLCCEKNQHANLLFLLTKIVFQGLFGKSDAETLF